MSDESPDQESQTEEPTEHKIKKARDKGNLPRSTELPIFLSFIAFSIITIFVGRMAFSRLAFYLGVLIERPEDWRLNNSEDFIQLLITFFKPIAVALCPIFVIIFLSGIAASVIQNAPQFILDRIQPKLNRISIQGGFKRIFGKSGMVEFLKSLAKFLAASIIVYLIFFHGTATFTGTLFLDPIQLPDFIRTQLARLFIANAIAIIVIAGADIAWSRFHWRRQLRMTRQELKEEHKELEGNPFTKSKMRSQARDRVRRRMLANVPKATLVITNPTHFAVALRYRPPEDKAPVVIAKGKNLIAQKIKEIAENHTIPTFENVELARALYKQVEVDQAIPEEFYYAVAELIRFIQRKARY